MNAPMAVIMAGGTGGHVFPALALADELSARGWRIHWLGGSHGIETRAVPAAGFSMDVLGTQGLRGRSVLARVKSVLLLVAAVLKAIVILRRHQPAVAVSLGGYSAGPGGIAARILGIPLVLHEQNAVAGLTNRVLAKIATACAQAFDGAIAGAVVTGNPVRKEIAEMAPPAQRRLSEHQPLRLLVFGGSQGAQALNESVAGAIAASGLTLDVRHQAGRGKLAATESAYAKAGIQAQITEFIEDMAEAYAWADLVIGRSGALTVSELACAGVPAILVPLPSAVDDHQTKNGRWLARQGAADVLPQSKLKDQLPVLLKHWLEHPERLIAAAEKGRGVAIVDATARLADLCTESTR